VEWHACSCRLAMHGSDVTDRCLRVLQGVILKITDDGRCLVGRILHGGMMHKLGKRDVFAVQLVDDYRASHVRLLTFVRLLALQSTAGYLPWLAVLFLLTT